MLKPSLTEPRAMPSKASSQYSPASSWAEQNLEYRPKRNRIKPDLSRAEPSREWSLEPSRVGYRAKTRTEPSRADLRAKPARIRVPHWAWVRPRAKRSRAPTKLRAKPAQSWSWTKRSGAPHNKAFFHFHALSQLEIWKLRFSCFRHAGSGHHIGTYLRRLILRHSDHVWLVGWVAQVAKNYHIRQELFRPPISLEC